MLTRLRLALASVFVAASVLLAVPLSGATGGLTAAYGQCPGSTNWDNFLQICR